MSENTKTEGKSTSELVSVTFRNGQNDEVTREVYPEVAKFINTRDQAREEMQKAQRLARRARQAYIWDKEDEYYQTHPEGQGGFDDYSTGRAWDRENVNSNSRVIENKYYDFVSGDRRDPADRRDRNNPNSWATLREEASAAGHKEVAWVVENCLEYETEATILVKYLPATPEELWEVAKTDHDMCQVFDRFMERAENAGLFKDVNLPAAIRETRALQSYTRRTYGSAHAREVMDRVRPIVKAEVEAALAKARAEWQQQDEAYAENVHRNRSEGARRAAETRRRNAELKAAVDAMEATEVASATVEQSETAEAIFEGNGIDWARVEVF